MRKAIVILVTIVLVLTPVFAEIDPKGKLDEQVLATAQKEWQIAAASAATGDEPAALAATERTFKLIQAAIVAAVGAGGDEKIEFVDVPTWANGAIFTAIGITDNGDYDVNIRTGTFPEGISLNCERLP